MKFNTGGIQEVAQESITSQMLMDAGVNNPDFVPTIMQLFKDDYMLNNVLNTKGMKTKGLHGSSSGENYRTVNSNHIRYRLSQSSFRMETFRANSTGVTFVDELGNTTTPGKFQAIVTMYSDTNWLGYQEIAELADDTQIWAINDPEETEDGIFATKIKLVTKNRDEYIDPAMLVDGAEFRVVANAHEQDFSERGVEKYEFKSWGDTYLSLSRFKYSWSGTAAAIMKGKKTVKGRFATHNQQTLFLSTAEETMMRRASKQLNFFHLFGRGTVSDTGKIMTKNLKGRDVMMGDGVIYSNDGPVHIPYNGWDEKFLQYLMAEIDNHISSDYEGTRSVYIGAAPMAFSSFGVLMRKLRVGAKGNVEGEGNNKGINDTYKYYELDGIRLIIHKEPSMGNKPRVPSANYEQASDWDMVMLPLGSTSDGRNGVELVQLRPMAKGTVAGIDMNENRISSSVDGSSTHVLFQTGVINQNKIFYIKKPILN